MHQVWSLVAVHELVAVTVNVVEPAGEATFWFGGITASVGLVAACVTVTTIGVSPVTVVVILATRELVVPLTVYVAVIVPLPDPDGFTVHHV